MSRIDLDGNLRDQEATVTIPLTLTLDQLALLDRAREVLSSGGKVPTNADIFTQALDALLHKRDPLRKAQRAQQRQASNQGGETVEAQVPGQVVPVQNLPEYPKSESIPPSALVPVQNAPEPTARPAIPAAIRHAVWLRDQGQCTWNDPNGRRCRERGMLELDHRTMYCRGGDHTVDNLTLKCRSHNQYEARINLGEEFWQQNLNKNI